MIHRFHCVFGCLFVLASTVFLAAQTFKAIQPPGSETAYSAGVLANGTLYVSGQGSSARKFPEQMSDAMRKVQAVLRGAGMDFGNVVWMNIYVTECCTCRRKGEKRMLISLQKPGRRSKM
jgi:hypothetical protein